MLPAGSRSRPFQCLLETALIARRPCFLFPSGPSTCFSKVRTRKSRGVPSRSAFLNVSAFLHSLKWSERRLMVSRCPALPSASQGWLRYNEGRASKIARLRQCACGLASCPSFIAGKATVLFLFVAFLILALPGRLSGNPSNVMTCPFAANSSERVDTSIVRWCFPIRHRPSGMQPYASKSGRTGVLDHAPLSWTSDSYHDGRMASCASWAPLAFFARELLSVWNTPYRIPP